MSIMSERIQPRQTPRVEDHDVVDIGSISGKELRFRGTPQDVSRVLEACKRSMRDAEQSQLGLDAQQVVIVRLDHN